MKYLALRFLCAMQVIFGFVLIAGGCLFFSAGSTIPNDSGGQLAQVVVWAISAGLVFAGIQVIALAQVFQCLMQIEINTRPANLQ